MCNWDISFLLYCPCYGNPSRWRSANAMFCSIVGGVCPWYCRCVDGIETPIKLETLVLLVGQGTPAPVLMVSMMTSPGVSGLEDWTITIPPSSSSECSEDSDDSDERPPTMMNWDSLCERTRLT